MDRRGKFRRIGVPREHMIAVACVASGQWNECIELLERVLARRCKDGCLARK